MPLELTLPDGLDDTGQRLWFAYRAARVREHAAVLHQRDAKRAMRRQINRGDVLDPAITAHYHAARDELDAARDERRSADMDYHAYHRMLMAQTLSRPRLQAQSASTDDDA